MGTGNKVYINVYSDKLIDKAGLLSLQVHTQKVQM